MSISLLKYITYGLILLILFHFETLSIGPIKISHLWKGSLLLFLLISILRKKKKQVLMYQPLLWLAFLQIINLELFNNTFNAFFLFGTTLVMPLIGIYSLKFSSKQLEIGLLFFSSFFILCFIPYELGLLESYGEKYELSGYGVLQSGIIGPFQGAHAASTALAGSFLIVMYFWFSKTFNRLYLSALLLIGFYFLIFTYVRTGMLMVLLGVLPMLIYFSKEKTSTRVRLIFSGVVFSFLISGWVLSNEVVMDRITGQRAHSSEMESFENLGSGRGLIYTYAVEIFNEAHIFEQLFGMGQTEQLNRMRLKLGIGLVPHNGFLLILLNNGILGLLVFLYFLNKIFNYTKLLNSKSRSLLRGLIYAYVVMCFFQNYDLIYMYLLLALCSALVFQENRQLKTKISLLSNPSNN